MKGVKREQSALLWRLLPSKARERVSRALTSAELTELGNAYAAYRKRSIRERRNIEAGLLREISGTRSIWPGIYGTAILTITLAFFLAVDLPLPLRLQVFAPLGIAFGGAMALYLIEPWRLRFLFRIPDASNLPALVIASLLLVWLIFAIGGREAGGTLRLDRTLLAALLFGAAAAPLAEEILFRELLVRAGGANLAIGHLFSILLFCAMHLPSDVEMAVLYVLSGSVLSVLRYTSDSLSLPLAAHSLANFIVTFARFY